MMKEGLSRRMQWESGPATLERAKAALSPMVDRHQAVEAVLNCRALTAKDEGALLDYMLLETKALGVLDDGNSQRADSEAEQQVAAGTHIAWEDDEGHSWRRQRLRLLQHRERLATLLALTTGCAAQLPRLPRLPCDSVMRESKLMHLCPSPLFLRAI